MTTDQGNYRIGNVCLVLSGKGGVGKSTTAALLAISLAARGHRVGLLDIDLCGPSIPKILGLEGQSVHKCSEGWVPVYCDSSKRLAVMSIGFLLTDKNEAVVWRGPKKTAMIKQFLTDVVWDDLDYLIIDTPPGTSDEHMAIVEALQQKSCNRGAILVTTPQNVSVGDVRREVTFCKKANLPVIGIVENMSGYTCSNCQECTYIFSSGGGEALAKLTEIPFLGSIPIDPALSASMETGDNFLLKFEHSEVAKIFAKVTAAVTNTSVSC